MKEQNQHSSRPHDDEGDDPLIGRILGKYRLVKSIGAGAFARVYEAAHIHLNVPFAIKILHPAFANHEEIVSRFFREARAASQLQHENVVFIADFDVEEGVGPYIVMEYLEGQTLQDALAEQGAMPLELVGELSRQICQVLGVAHRKGIVHRDLKPENIFLVSREMGRVLTKILDFGIAHLSQKSQSVTGARALGTPVYMAPELFRGGENTESLDIYSFGVILYEMLNGKPPFQGQNVQQLGIEHLLIPAPELDERFSSGLRQVQARLLAKTPEERPSSMEETWQLLAPVLDPERRFPHWHQQGLPYSHMGLPAVSTSSGNDDYAAMQTIAVATSLSDLLVQGNQDALGKRLEGGRDEEAVPTMSVDLYEAEPLASLEVGVETQTATIALDESLKLALSGEEVNETVEAETYPPPRPLSELPYNEDETQISRHIPPELLKRPSLSKPKMVKPASFQAEDDLLSELGDGNLLSGEGAPERLLLDESETSQADRLASQGFDDGDFDIVVRSLEGSVWDSSELATPSESLDVSQTGSLETPTADSDFPALQSTTKEDSFELPDLLDDDEEDDETRTQLSSLDPVLLAAEIQQQQRQQHPTLPAEAKDVSSTQENPMPEEDEESELLEQDTMRTRVPIRPPSTPPPPMKRAMEVRSPRTPQPVTDFAQPSSLLASEKETPERRGLASTPSAAPPPTPVTSRPKEPFLGKKKSVWEQSLDFVQDFPLVQRLNSMRPAEKRLLLVVWSFALFAILFVFVLLLVDWPRENKQELPPPETVQTGQHSERMAPVGLPLRTKPRRRMDFANFRMKRRPSPSSIRMLPKEKRIAGSLRRYGLFTVPTGASVYEVDKQNKLVFRHKTPWFTKIEAQKAMRLLIRASGYQDRVVLIRAYEDLKKTTMVRMEPQPPKN